MKNKLFIISALVLFVAACKKDDVQNNSSSATAQQFISDYSTKVVYENYKDLEQKAILLETAVSNFAADRSNNKLAEACAAWRNCRQAWEQSEAYLFGPVATENLDPSIDTWPINYKDMDSLLASNAQINEAFLHQVQESLKGFHPLEYMLFGEKGNKSAAEFNDRQLVYSVALAQNIATQCAVIRTSWDPALGNFMINLTAPGAGKHYESKRAVMEQIVKSLIEICEEVGEEKIGQPFVSKDPSLEESPFSKASLSDFENNMKGVQNVFLGQYGISTGRGLSHYLSGNNLALKLKLEQNINAVLGSFNTITMPFGEAILLQASQVSNLQAKIASLKTVLEDELLPFVILNVKD